MIVLALFFLGVAVLFGFHREKRVWIFVPACLALICFAARQPVAPKIDPPPPPNMTQGVRIVWRDLKQLSSNELEQRISKGLDVNAHYDDGNLVSLIAGQPNRAKVLHLLIQRGADPNDLNWNRGSALHYAIRNNRVESVRALIEEKADLNLEDGLGHTPLHAAVMVQNRAIIRMLLAAGANRNVRDRSGATPFQLAGDIELLLKKAEERHGR